MKYTYIALTWLFNKQYQQLKVDTIYISPVLVYYGNANKICL